MSKKGWIAWSVLVASGAVTVAWPDTGVRLFSISNAHGPSAIDAVGTVLILGGWSALWAGVWARRSELPRGRIWRTTIATALSAGLLLTAWSVLGDQGAWWVLGVVLLAVPQVVAAVAVSRR